jgi:hypothetical protein
MCRQCNRKYFTFSQVKSSASYIRVISKLHSWPKNLGAAFHARANTVLHTTAYCNALTSISELKLAHAGSVVLPIHPHLAATLRSASLLRHKKSWYLLVRPRTYLYLLMFISFKFSKAANQHDFNTLWCLKSQPFHFYWNKARDAITLLYSKPSI